ncbi:hypothetical protein HB375_07885 [Microvirga sp. c23x22]|uniref:Flagellar biosynthesis protein, FliO n=1 Tax=Microvirga terricola TaxID=2719797 RepID=A0ABX0VA55_9HYPH|nr:hypothetical protein [Microvirga terricola]
MERAAQYLIAFAIILALVALFGLVLRKLTGARLMLSGQDRARSRQPRLGVVDIYDLDRQRQLVLLRRDNVEHLLLIGGLNDVVIETNIVRVAGARLAPTAGEPGMERFEPALEAPRPQVEPSGRPSIETQLAAQLGAFIKRPSEESDSEEELSPVASITAPLPVHAEPALKPDVVTLAHPAAAAPAGIPGLRAEARAPSFPSAPAAPEPIFPRAEPRFTPPPPPPQPSFRAPPPPPPPPVVPEVVRVPEPPPVEKVTPDAAILSDMAKQLEEALKRPATPVTPEPVRAPEPIDEDELLEPAPAAPAHKVEFEEEDLVSEPEPVVQAPLSPVQPKAAEPAAPAPAKKAADPFSVEEIEAEFARLLGRPMEPGKKE